MNYCIILYQKLINLTRELQNVSSLNLAFHVDSNRLNGYLCQVRENGSLACLNIRQCIS